MKLLDFLHETFSLLFLPTFIVVGAFIIHSLSLGFWGEILSFYPFLFIPFCLVTLKERNNYYSKKKEVRDILTLSVLPFFCGVLIDTSNRNEVTILVVIIITVLAVWGMFSMMRGVIKSNRYGTLESDQVFETILAGVLVIITALALTKYYEYFGTQWIWMITISWAVVVMVMLKKEEVLSTDESFFVIGVVVLLGLVSTIYQFWGAELFLGILLWQLLTFLLIALISVSVAFFAFTRIKAKREKKRKLEMEREEEEKRKAELVEKKKKDEEELKSVQEKIKKIQGEQRASWEEIFSLAKYFSYRTNHVFFSPLIQVIVGSKLSELVMVSDIKKQIVWDTNFKLALQILEDITRHSFNDVRLGKLILSLGELFSYISHAENEKYAGSEEIKKELELQCSTLFALYNAKKLEV